MLSDLWSSDDMQYGGDFSYHAAILKENTVFDILSLQC